MAKVTIELQKRGFCVDIPMGTNFQRVNWEKLNDALFALPNVCEVDGPVVNGAMGVIYDSDDRSDAELIAELQKVFNRFIR